MTIFLVLTMLFQGIATPIANGSLIVSPGAIDYPPLPQSVSPIAINEDWEILYYDLYAGRDQYVLRGEMRNTSDNWLSTPTVIASIGDAETRVHPDIREVGPGERAPFAVPLQDDDIIAALNESPDILFSGVCEDFYGVVPRRDHQWDFTDVAIDFDSSEGAVRVTGSVVNEGTQAVEGYAPTLFGFTTDGRYLGSIYDADVRATFPAGTLILFNMDHGFDSFFTSDPFAPAGQDVIFVLGMAPPVRGYSSCI